MKNTRKDPIIEWEEVFEFQPVSFFLMVLTVICVGPLPFFIFASMGHSSFRFWLLVFCYLATGFLLILTITTFKREKNKETPENLLKVFRKVNAVFIVVSVIFAQLFLIFGELEGSALFKCLAFLILGIPGYIVAKKYLWNYS